MGGSEGPGYTQPIRQPPERDDFLLMSSRSILLFEHDLFGKPAPTPHQVRGKLFRIMLLEFVPSRQALAAKAEFAFVRPMPKAEGKIAVVEAALNDVFVDDITFPAKDGYLLGASLFLPRGAKRHAVLINSATAVPRKIYRGFAGYLARRGCAVLTYDYRGTGDSRQKSLVGYNQQKS